MAKYEEAATFNLGAVVQETGINPDTLRAWERRYGLPQPGRSEGGHRLYSRLDIQTVKWLLERQDEGIRIGRAVELWQEMKRAGKDPFREKPLHEEEGRAYDELFAGEDGAGSQDVLDQMRTAWLEAALTYSEEKANRIFDDALARFTIERATYEILLKGMREIGERWYSGEISVQGEHFTSGLAVRRVQALISGSPPPWRSEQIIVACSPAERHDFAPLLITLYLRRDGYPVIYLGADVPYRDLEDVVLDLSADLMILSAQTLGPAASLYRAGKKLVENNLPLAYGGWIFHQLSDLETRMPGLFLGNSLFKVAENVRHVLDQRQLALEPGKMIPETYRDLLETYLDSESLLLERMMRWNKRELRAREEIDMITSTWSEGIKASLILANLEYLDHEIEWVAGLLAHRGGGGESLSRFLMGYAQAVEDITGEDGKELTDWIRDRAQRI